VPHTAFNSRILKHIYFGLPNEEARAAILWHTIPASLPHDETINKETILEESKFIDGFSGRDIKNAILDMLLRKAGESTEDACFCIADLHNALLAKEEQKRLLKEEEQRALKNRIARKLKEKVAEQAALKEQNMASEISDSKTKDSEA
jgi:AAA+ superfamily predicted ATPase